MVSAFETLPVDLLIHILQFIQVRDIISLRQTSKQLHAITLLRPIWISACTSCPLFHDSSAPLDTLSTAELEQRAHRAEHLRSFWLQSSSSNPRVCKVFTSHSTAITYVRFLPNRRWLVAILTGIWSTLILCDLDEGGNLLDEWTPKQASIDAVVVNSDVNSSVHLAISLTHQSGVKYIDLFTISQHGHLSNIKTIQTSYAPILLQGKFLAYSDARSQTILHNLSTDDTSTFDSSSTEHIPFRNQCVQILFTHQSILIIREQSLHFFPFTESIPDIVHPIASYSLGWLEGVCAAEVQQEEGEEYPAVRILSRPLCQDPWAKDIHKIDLHILHPNPNYTIGLSACPYLPPCSHADISHSYTGPPGSLLCPRVQLGKHGTALWIQNERHAYTMVGMFLGQGEPKELFRDKADWMCFDYDEIAGMFALGLTSGGIITVEL